MYQSVNANFDDMGYTWNAGRSRDLHDFLSVAWQTDDVNKACKIVMKSKIVSNTIYKTHIKNLSIFDYEKYLD